MGAVWRMTAALAHFCPSRKCCAIVASLPTVDLPLALPVRFTAAGGPA